MGAFIIVMSVLIGFTASYETNETVRMYVDDANTKAIEKIDEVNEKIESKTQPLDYSKLNG